eukprot:CAMPEP_0197861030 /NCGR_PEP_ID=MMETSP1438-20131217/36810_1 /TAXON_ID=1461541 /ORGANISM="Pterosperma sp., Strain CCMP1384" /LENGTH=321 /DNA_ID=CAMNT_0043478087 /DNA_START=568 /DNA_END=1530 /DNA_ORIENTATION=-
MTAPCKRAPSPDQSWPVPITPVPTEEAHRIESERAQAAQSCETGDTDFSQYIVYEDDWLLAIDKPVGAYCETVERKLAAAYPKERIVLAHRLDRDTGGVLLLTRCPQATKAVGRTFTEGLVKKSYLALCCPTKDTGVEIARPNFRLKDEVVVSTGHGRSKFGLWRVYSEDDVGAKLPGGSKVRSMETRFAVYSNNVSSSSGETSRAAEVEIDSSHGHERPSTEASSNANTHTTSQLNAGSPAQPSEGIILRAYPVTGRTHQIRLHAAHIGYPLVGDVRYGGPEVWDSRKWTNHLLHAMELSFPDPRSIDKTITIAAKLPEW